LLFDAYRKSAVGVDLDLTHRSPVKVGKSSTSRPRSDPMIFRRPSKPALGRYVVVAFDVAAVTAGFPSIPSTQLVR